MTLATPPIVGPGAVPADLLARAHGAARWLAAHRIAEGSRVAVDSPDPLPWFLGADLLGAACLVAEPTWTPRERDAVLADARPDLVVTGVAKPLPEPLPESVAHASARDAGHVGDTRNVGDVGVAPAGDDGTFFYLPTTSGSSARPKVLIRTRRSWLRSFAALGPLPGPVLIPGPLSSSLFLFGALHALWCGHRVQSLSCWEPERAALAAQRAATVHLVPAMLAGLLAVLERRPDLREGCALRTVVCGGAHLGDDTRERFARLLPGAELIEYYGSAEHSLIALRRGTDGLRPVPGVRLDVRDGLLWVSSPLAFSGRLRGGTFHPAEDEWSTVGDQVELDGTGALTVRGRAGAVVSSGGKLVAAEEVEAVLRTVPAVTDVLVTGTPHPTLGAIVTAVIETTADGPPTLRELRAAARAGLEPGKRPRRWLATEALPRTASGKPARATVAERLRDGTLAAEPMR
ncbi:AMP-binding protein [Microtetraspora glauca]|uniref:AMP-binding protein n=1 Tax=Microtetraspora glauca TaxID=1996 RepID=A0ABV3GH17_MICGL